jgi:Pyruvate/2-oxoacid:ferredoxin oxidoreductase delta subunit
MKVNEEDLYRRLGKKIDGLTVRTPWNRAFYDILKELYTAEEADVIVRMPYTLSSLQRISKVTGIEEVRLRSLLDGLCSKGLILDLWNERENQYYYMACPLVVGIFEFTMMRTGGNLNTKQWSKLFQEYFPSVYPENFSRGERTTVLRVIPVEETIHTGEGLEFFDYEKASSLIDCADRYALGICSCRNEKHHLGEKTCDAPLDNCSMFGISADYMIRHNLAREVSKTEMLENFARSREHGLVLSAYNTRRNPISVCHCCKCCCNYLAGMNKFGFQNSVITSNFIASLDAELCKGCGKCAKLCPANALSLVPAQGPEGEKKNLCSLNAELCVGCGVCVSKCQPHALTMKSRTRKMIQPESLFEVTILGALERDTLQNQIFDNPGSITQQFMRIFLGAFLRLSPVKRSLMSDKFRSSFLSFMKFGADLQGKGWITRM